LFFDEEAYIESWNFGPATDEVLSVREVADLFTAAWGDGADWSVEADSPASHREAGQLAVDSTLARRELGWRPRWNATDAVKRTASWYRRRAEGINSLTLVYGDIEDFLDKDPERH